MTGVTIADEDDLYRRLHSQHINPKTGKVRANAYKIPIQNRNQPEHEPSVEIARISDPYACAARDGRIGWGAAYCAPDRCAVLGLAFGTIPFPMLPHMRFWSGRSRWTSATN